jgi:hypothetical protein
VHDDDVGVRRAEQLIRLVLRRYPQAWYTEGPFNEWPIVSAGLIRRAAQCMAAIVALQPGGFHSDAAVLMRTLFEHVNVFAWLAVSPNERIGPWLKNDLRQRIAANKALIGNGEKGLITDEIVAQYEAYMAGVTGTYPNPEQQAKDADDHWSAILERQPTWKDAGGFSGMFRVTYRHTSKFAHPTVIGLQTHLTEFGRGVVVLDTEQPEMDPSPFAFAPGVLGMGLRIASAALGWPGLDEIDAIFTEWVPAEAP